MAPDPLDDALRRAAALFNEAHYYEAHDLLDEQWLDASPADSDFIKGLIQACVALHHFQQGNPAGARKLYSGQRQYLAPYLPVHRGVAVARFLGSMQAAFEPLLRAPSGAEPAFAQTSRPRLEFLDSA